MATGTTSAADKDSAAAIKATEKAQTEQVKANQKEREEKVKQAEKDDVDDGSISQPPSPTQPRTSLDSNGIERIVSVGQPNWEPAPIDPDPAAVKAAEAREKAAADERKTRLGKNS